MRVEVPFTGVILSGNRYFEVERVVRIEIPEHELRRLISGYDTDTVEADGVTLKVVHDFAHFVPTVRGTPLFGPQSCT